MVSLFFTLKPDIQNYHLGKYMTFQFHVFIHAESFFQWLFPVPIKGGIGSIFHPPRFGKDYKWYISGIFPANWGMDD